jgi:hypothetical protein
MEAVPEPVNAALLVFGVCMAASGLAWRLCARAGAQD